MVQVHRSADLRRSLIVSALALLDGEGIEGITIRACAKASGVSHAAPAKHFSSRRALLTELAVQCMADLTNDVLIEVGAAEASPRARLGALADAAVGYALVRPNRYRLMWRTDLLDRGDRALQQSTNRLFSQIEAIVAELPPPPNATRETLVIAICSAIHGYISMRIDGNFRPASDEAAPRPRQRALIDLLLALPA